MIDIEISVGEPFDFKSSDGQNILYCSADVETSVGQFEESQYLLVRCTPFVYGGLIVQYLRLVPRYQKDSFSLMEKLLSGQDVNVNAEWLNSGDEWTHELATLPNKERARHAAGALIGGASLRDSPNE